MYKISADKSRKFIAATLSGFMTADEVFAMDREIQTHITSFGNEISEHLVLIDSSECTAQSQEVVAAFQTVLHRSRRPAKRLAVVNSGALLRMQIRRMLVRDSTAVFETHVQAHEWLFDGIRSEAA